MKGNNYHNNCFLRETGAI